MSGIPVVLLILLTLIDGPSHKAAALPQGWSLFPTHTLGPLTQYGSGETGYGGRPQFPTVLGALSTLPPAYLSPEYPSATLSSDSTTPTSTSTRAVTTPSQVTASTVSTSQNMVAQASAVISDPATLSFAPSMLTPAEATNSATSTSSGNQRVSIHVGKGVQLAAMILTIASGYIL